MKKIKYIFKINFFRALEVNQRLIALGWSNPRSVYTRKIQLNFGTLSSILSYMIPVTHFRFSGSLENKSLLSWYCREQKELHLPRIFIFLNLFSDFLADLPLKDLFYCLSNAKNIFLRDSGVCWNIYWQLF